MLNIELNSGEFFVISSQEGTPIKIGYTGQGFEKKVGSLQEKLPARFRINGTTIECYNRECVSPNGCVHPIGKVTIYGDAPVLRQKFLVAASPNDNVVHRIRVMMQASFLEQSDAKSIPDLIKAISALAGEILEIYPQTQEKIIDLLAELNEGQTFKAICVGQDLEEMVNALYGLKSAATYAESYTPAAS